LFRDTPVDSLTPNVLALQIQPDEGISLQFGAKLPGPEIKLGGVKMDSDIEIISLPRPAPATKH
jgi:glucose-6-phosphate 1-dehydrogenase